MQYAEGIGNYLYIILAVIYVIYSIVKAGKKVSQNRPQAKKPVPSASPKPVETYSPPPSKEDDLKKMLEDLLGGVPEIKIPEKQKPVSRPQTAQARPAPAKVIPKHPKKDKLVSQAVKPSSSRKAETPAVEHFVSHPEVIQKSFGMQAEEADASSVDFDLRQAILYSEILKRPNY